MTTNEEAKAMRAKLSFGGTIDSETAKEAAAMIEHMFKEAERLQDQFNLEIAQNHDTWDSIPDRFKLSPSDGGGLPMPDAIAAMVAEIDDLSSRVKVLEDALRPFANHYQSWMDKHADNVTSTTFPIHTMGDLRRARAALEGSDDTR